MPVKNPGWGCLSMLHTHTLQADISYFAHMRVCSFASWEGDLVSSLLGQGVCVCVCGSGKISSFLGQFDRQTKRERKGKIFFTFCVTRRVLADWGEASAPHSHRGFPPSGTCSFSLMYCKILHVAAVSSMKYTRRCCTLQTAPGASSSPPPLARNCNRVVEYALSMLLGKRV